MLLRYFFDFLFIINVQNDADGVQLNVNLYDKQENVIDNFVVGSEADVVIDLIKYDEISWISVDYTWSNNEQEYQSISSIIFDEYIGNGFDLINNLPYKYFFKKIVLYKFF